MTLQHAQREHHIVGRVGDVVAERGLALAQGRELRLDRLAALLERSAKLGNLVVAFDVNRLFGAASKLPNRLGELSHAANDRTCGEQRDEDHDQRDEERWHQNSAGEPWGRPLGAHQHHRTRALVPSHPHRDLRAPLICRAIGGDVLAGL